MRNVFWIPRNWVGCSLLFLVRFLEEKKKLSGDVLVLPNLFCL